MTTEFFTKTHVAFAARGEGHNAVISIFSRAELEPEALARAIGKLDHRSVDLEFGELARWLAEELPGAVEISIARGDGVSSRWTRPSPSADNAGERDSRGSAG